MQLAEVLTQTIRDVSDYPKPGIVFKDITPILANPGLVKDVVQALAKPYRDQHIDAVAGVEARGFIFGSLLAHELGCGFIPVRKAGRLPYKSIQQSYDLEYGSAALEMHIDAVKPSWKVLIHDDLLATGGTAGATGELIEKLNGMVAGFSFLVNLSFLPGEAKLSSRFQVKSNYLVSY